MSRIRYPLGHFPFPVPHTNAEGVGPLTLYPVGFPLEQAMRLYSHTRTYQAAGSCLADLSAYPERGYTESADIETLLQIYERGPDAGLAGDESIMCALPPPDYFASHGVVTSHNAVLGVFGGMFHVPNVNFGLDDFPRILLNEDDDLYYPLMAVSVHYGQSTLDLAGTLIFNSYAGYIDPAAMLFESPESSFSFFGVTVPAVAYRSNDLITGTGSGGIAPQRWWSYANHARLEPLLDELTGEISVNPATGVPYTPAEIVAASWP